VRRCATCGHENREGGPAVFQPICRCSGGAPCRPAGPARAHQALHVRKVLQASGGAFVGEEVGPPKYANRHVIKRCPQATWPRTSELNTGDLGEDVDPQRRQADLKHDARGRQVAHGEMLYRRAECAQRRVGAAARWRESAPPTRPDRPSPAAARARRARRRRQSGSGHHGRRTRATDRESLRPRRFSRHPCTLHW